MFSVSPHIQRLAVPVREDSSIEPPALRAARWPSTRPPPLPFPTAPPPTQRRFPRSYTAPVAFPHRQHSPSSSPSSSPPPSNSRLPVQLTPGLSPSLRHALPQPKPLRPPPPPAHSDLSAASTRAENEPLALRDLRRVTAPPALMDPWLYDRHRHTPRVVEKDRDLRRFFGKSPSNTSVVTDRQSDALGRHTHSPPHLQHRRFRISTRFSQYPNSHHHHHHHHHHRRRFFLTPRLPFHLQPQQSRPSTPVPDRFHDSFVLLHDQNPTNHDDSVLSALTRESDIADDAPVRPRTMSEPSHVQRRVSFMPAKHKVLSVWDRIWRRKRRLHPSSSHPDRFTSSSPPQSPPSPAPPSPTPPAAQHTKQSFDPHIRSPNLLRLSNAIIAATTTTTTTTATTATTTTTTSPTTTTTTTAQKTSAPPPPPPSTTITASPETQVSQS